MTVKIIKKTLSKKRSSNRTKSQIYKDLVYEVNLRSIYPTDQNSYTTETKNIVLNELYKRFKNKTIKSSSIKEIKSDYSIK